MIWSQHIIQCIQWIVCQLFSFILFSNAYFHSVFIRDAQFDSESEDGEPSSFYLMVAVNVCSYCGEDCEPQVIQETDQNGVTYSSGQCEALFLHRWEWLGDRVLTKKRLFTIVFYQNKNWILNFSTVSLKICICLYLTLVQLMSCTELGNLKDILTNRQF